LEAELALGWIGLVGADERVRLRLAVLVAHLDDGAETHHVTAELFRTHDDRTIETLGEQLHAPIDLAQALLAVDILGILGAIALGGSLGHLAHHLGALDAHQPLQLAGELFVTSRGEVVGGSHLSGKPCGGPHGPGPWRSRSGAAGPHRRRSWHDAESGGTRNGGSTDRCGLPITD
jgi:hypothetical protein